MSTIVAVMNKRKICMAADSLTTFGEVRQSNEFDATSEKILACGEQGYIGIVGSAAHHSVMRHALKHHLELLDLASADSIYQSFLRLHPILKDEYYLNPKDTEDDAYESSRIDALIISPAGIFGVYALREVFAYKKFWAVGAGAEIALGALHAESRYSEDVELLAQHAIEASATFHTSTALPVSSYCVDRTA